MGYVDHLRRAEEYPPLIRQMGYALSGAVLKRADIENPEAVQFHLDEFAQLCANFCQVYPSKRPLLEPIATSIFAAFENIDDFKTLVGDWNINVKRQLKTAGGLQVFAALLAHRGNPPDVVKKQRREILTEVIQRGLTSSTDHMADVADFWRLIYRALISGEPTPLEPEDIERLKTVFQDTPLPENPTE